LQPGAAATLLTFSGGTRENHGTIDFTGTGRTKWTGMANDSFGIVAAYVTAGNEWATVGGDGRVTPLSTYNTNINSAAPADNVKIVGGGTTNLAASTQAATLNFQNSSGSTGTLDIGSGQSLALGDGGILTSGTSSSQILDGTLMAGSTGELVVTNRNALTISSTIADSVPGTGLTKSGAGTLTLTGSNTYSGVTAIDQGTVVVSSDANLGTGTAVEINGATLKAAQSFSSTKSFTNTTAEVGTVDTGGFNLTFSSVNTGAIEKTGAGTLTLTNPAPGTVIINQGALNLPNPTSGSVTLQGGSLLAAGTLSSLTFSFTAGLDIGGAAAATLTTQQFFQEASSGRSLTVEFGLGISTSDLWKITSFLNFGGPATNTFLFDFQNLGDAAPGTYTLMNIQSGGFSLTPSMFGFAPSALAAGWNGTFSVNTTSSTTVTVNITSTPEPDSLVLIALGALGVFRRRRTR
jgi:autotransporter-associated beta strand protein